MGAITRDEVREILEEIIKEQSQKNTAENTGEIQSKGEQNGTYIKRRSNKMFKW